MSDQDTYRVLYADPPWNYPSLKGVTQMKDGSYASRNPCGADAHYDLMTDQDLLNLSVADIAHQDSAIFLWATCPRLDFAIDVMKSWGFHYRGIAYVWVKVNLDGTPMGAKGPPPSFVKPTTEMLLVGSTKKKGRVFPLMDYKQRQVVFEPRGKHSAKPPVFRKNIEDLVGDVSKIELFARTRTPGWDAWGDEVQSDIKLEIK